MTTAEAMTASQVHRVVQAGRLNIDRVKVDRVNIDRVNIDRANADRVNVDPAAPALDIAPRRSGRRNGPAGRGSDMMLSGIWGNVPLENVQPATMFRPPGRAPP
jgi:hypothetical protein